MHFSLCMPLPLSQIQECTLNSSTKVLPDQNRHKQLNLRVWGIIQSEFMSVWKDTELVEDHWEKLCKAQPSNPIMSNKGLNLLYVSNALWCHNWSVWKHHAFTMIVIDVFSQKITFPKIWLKAFIEMNREFVIHGHSNIWYQVITDDFNFCLI